MMVTPWDDYPIHSKSWLRNTMTEPKHQNPILVLECSTTYETIRFLRQHELWRGWFDEHDITVVFDLVSYVMIFMNEADFALFKLTWL